MKLKNLKGFTLIELLVVIVIIGILATLTTVGLSTARVKARDAKRISDIKQMQTALELYYNEENTYPPTSALDVGKALVGTQSGKTFMGKIPAGPNTGETYTYAQINSGTSYTLSYVLEKPVNEFGAGLAIALPGSINNQCTPDCSGKSCGPNGCGGICGTACTGSTPVCKSDYTACVGCNTNSDCSGTPATPYCVGNACSATRSTPCSDTASAAVECNSSSAYGSICGGGYLVCKSGDNNCGNINLVAAPSGCNGSSGAVGTVCTCATDGATVVKTWSDTNPGSAIGLFDAVYGLNNFSDGADSTTATAFYTGNTANYDAANYCLNLTLSVGGVPYSDWYLPAAKELAAIIKSSEHFYSYSSKYTSNAYYGENTTSATLINASSNYNATPLISALIDSRVAGLQNGAPYWSSTEYAATSAWLQYTNSGRQYNVNDRFKESTANVRCVRRF
ncbi:MAG: DUF1566 domain-containing protein [Patescibacteria group bacterium]|nr:DUF1566 domain-containing protein [Patescibacteria group bacterium]